MRNTTYVANIKARSQSITMTAENEPFPSIFCNPIRVQM